MVRASAPTPPSPELPHVAATGAQSASERAGPHTKPSLQIRSTRVPARPIIVVNSGIEESRLKDDHAIEGRHVECASVAQADELFLEHPDAELLAMVCDGRDWVVARALRRRELAQRDAPPFNGLFSRRELVDEIGMWIDRSSASLRLVELDALTTGHRADGRVQLLIEEPSLITTGGGRQTPLWRWWLTEDHQAIIRSAAGSLLAELGYTRRDDR